MQYSESPVLIRHYMPIELSLKVLDTVKFKLEHVGPSFIKGKQNSIKRKNTNINTQKQPSQSIIIFKNRTFSQFDPKKKISGNKLSKIIKLSHVHDEKINEKINEPINSSKKMKTFAQSEKNKSNYHLNPSLKDRTYSCSSIILKPPVKDQSKAQVCIKQTSIKKSQSAMMNLQKQREKTGKTTRKNSLMFNFKKDLSSSRSNRKILLESVGLWGDGLLIGRRSCELSQQDEDDRSRNRYDTICIEGKKVPSYD